MTPAAEKYTRLLQSYEQHTLNEITTMPAGRRVNAYAVITEMSTVRLSNSRNPMWFHTISLSDPTVAEGSVINISFHKDKDSLPKNDLHRVLVLKNVSVNIFQDRCQLVARPASDGAVYTTVDMETLTEYPSSNVSCRLTEADRKIIGELSKWHRAQKKKGKMQTASPGAFASTATSTASAASSDAQSRSTSRSHRPVVTTEAIKGHSARFFDYIGMVVNCIRQTDRVVLVLTDFTANPAPLEDRGPQRGINNSLLLQCTLWDNHARNCPKELKFGDYVYLYNCNINTRCPYGLETRINGSHDTRQYVQLLTPEFEGLKELLQRKERYFDGLKKASANRKRIIAAKIDNDGNDSSSSRGAEEKKRKVEGRNSRASTLSTTGKRNETDSSDLSDGEHGNDNGVSLFDELITMNKEDIPVDLLQKAIIRKVEPADASLWIKTVCSKCCRTYGLAEDKCDHLEANIALQFNLQIADPRSGRVFTVTCSGEKAEQFLDGFSASDYFFEADGPERLKELMHAKLK